jgi:hypothetical protein
VARATLVEIIDKARQSDWPITFPQFLANKIPHFWFNNTGS